jgi:hypothetical protein
MVSSKLTDEELVELAKQEQQDYDNDRLDVAYYQEYHLIRDGKDRVFSKHLYSHYKKWSVDPISLEIFVDMLQLNRKDYISISINKVMCNINLEKVLGDYVKEDRKKKKEERLRQISSIKPKT